jgi:hypothetical protein
MAALSHLVDALFFHHDGVLPRSPGRRELFRRSATPLAAD